MNNNLVKHGNPEIRYWNGIIPMLSMPLVSDYWISPFSTDVSSQSSNVFWTWIRFNDVSAYTRYICGRYNSQYSWSFACTTPDDIKLRLSTNGIALAATYTKSVPAYDLTKWHFMAFEFLASTRVRIWIDDNMSEWVIGIPAALFSGDSLFRLGDATKCDMILPAWNGGEHLSSPTIDYRSWFNVFYTATRPMFY